MSVTIEEIVALTGASTRAVRRWVVKGQLAPIRRGAHPLRFHEDEVYQCWRDRYDGGNGKHARRDRQWREICESVP